MNILVFCPNLIGDTVMATPTFRAIRKGFSGARIVAIVKPSVAPTLDGGPWFDDRILFDPRSPDRDKRALAVLGKLRRERADLAVLFPNSLRSAWIALFGGAKRRIGYARGGRGLLLTDRLDPPRDPAGRFSPTPIVEYYARLAKALDCPPESLKLELFTTFDDEAAADLAWSRLGFDRDSRVVCLNTGGAFGPAKNWPIESFVETALGLVESFDVSVLALCGPSERETAREIASRANHPRVASLADSRLSIGLSKAAVKRAALLITTDSGPRHFAAAFGVPAISLFGPTHIAWTRTHHPLAVHLRHPVPCGPCQKPICPEGHHLCMRNLSPRSVLDAASRLLATRAASRPQGSRD